MSSVSSRIQIKQRYRRADGHGVIPRSAGLPNLDENRLGVFWRPLIDLSDSPTTALRLRMIGPVNAWLTDPASERWSWFSRIGLAGLRHQVIRHAGLDAYDCTEPAGLAPELRTTGWGGLVQAVEHFRELDTRRRALVLFQLAQLSFQRVAIRLAGDLAPAGTGVGDGNGNAAAAAEHTRYLYEIARVHAASPGGTTRALELFENIADAAADPLIALAACFQGIGHSLRSVDRRNSALRFAARGRAIPKSAVADGWHARLVRSRFHRATALLALDDRDIDAARRELDTALGLHAELASQELDASDGMVVQENRRYLLEVELTLARQQGDSAARDALPGLCALLLSIDPYCVQARLSAGDAFAALGDIAIAADHYRQAGELGTGAGALGWFRAAQCFEALGECGQALHAMGRVLELDPSAIEAREYLASGLRP